MEKINFFLERFRNIEVPNKALIESIQKSFLKNIGSEIDKENIKITNGGVFIKASPIQKSEFLLKKKEIIEDLEKDILQKAPKIK